MSKIWISENHAASKKRGANYRFWFNNLVINLLYFITIDCFN